MKSKPNSHTHSSAKRWVCTFGCGERFDSYGKYIVHEQKAHLRIGIFNSMEGEMTPQPNWPETAKELILKYVSWTGMVMIRARHKALVSVVAEALAQAYAEGKESK